MKSENEIAEEKSIIKETSENINDSEDQRIKDLKSMRKWFYLFLIWFVICLISLLFIPLTLSLGLWFLVIGITMHINKENYRLWYNRMYDTNY